MRLFLAIELPDAIRRGLADISSRLRTAPDLSGCSWVRTENLHVTLKFFGEVPEATLPAICESLNQVRLDGSIRLKASRMELLPPHGPVRVIAAGLEGDRWRLEELHGQIEKRCADVGFPPEARKFRPHVTLARARRPLSPGVRGEIEERTAELLPLEELVVNDFVLMESRLKPDAAQYIPLARFKLDREQQS
ncbi:MAG TPA: RNA 2',3'-cyclic phosphodiesterase [Tepidisphaeraceae bacterium]|nr:RNA 2',3'-cyclic phosphodiesterase [Tepidisphaeraceae bacterium]